MFKTLFFLSLLLIVQNIFAQQQTSRAGKNVDELPIKPTRTISFSTDEGSYMDLDISPDGKTLVFDLLGDIYTLPVTGGVATQITRGMALNLRPTWSPDGKRIAYFSDATGSFHLHVRDIQGDFHQVLGKEDDEIEVHFPFESIWMTGNHGALVGQLERDKPFKIYNVATGQPNLDKLPSLRNLIHFSPNGKLAYCISDIKWMEEFKLLKYDFLKDTVTEMVKLPYAMLDGTLSPDGRWWACRLDSSNQNMLVLRDLGNNMDKILVPSLKKHFNYKTPATPPQRFAFSQDSKSIFISYGGKIHHIDILSGRDQIIPFMANVKVDMGSLNYNTFRIPQDSFKVKYTRSASTSPDGKRLVFSALNKIYIIDLPNGKPRVLVPQSFGQYHPVFSPDSKWVAYVSWSDSAQGQLWKVPVGGGLPTRITTTAGMYQNPTWSPDGKSIAIVKGKEGRLTSMGTLVMLSADGGGKILLNKK